MSAGADLFGPRNLNARMFLRTKGDLEFRVNSAEESTFFEATLAD